MLEPELGFNSDRNLVIIHLENPKKAPRTTTNPDAKAAIISGVIVNIHQVYNSSRLTFGGNMQTLNSQPDSMDWRVYRNDSTAMTLVFVDANDVALDLTDWTFTGQVRQFPTNTTVLDSMDIVKNANVLTIGLDTQNLDVMNFFDIQGIHGPTEKIATVLSGTIYLEEDVTR
jgi:hypothetical protein